MEMKRETGFADFYFLSLWERTEVRALQCCRIQRNQKTRARKLRVEITDAEKKLWAPA